MLTSKPCCKMSFSAWQAPQIYRKLNDTSEPPLGSATDSAAEKISDHGRGRSVNLKPSKHKKQRNATDVHCSHLHTISYNYLYGNCDSVHIWSYTLRQAIIDWGEVLNSKLCSYALDLGRMLSHLSPKIGFRALLMYTDANGYTLGRSANLRTLLWCK